MRIKVLLADDHTVVLDGLRAVIENIGKDIEIVGEASNGSSVLKLARQKKIDVYVLDISMPILNGIETTDRLIQTDPQSKIIMLSMHDDRTLVERSLESGAKGYIVKKDAAVEVLHAIREVHKGGAYLSPSVAKYVIDGFLSSKRKEPKKTVKINLTRKEKEILQLIAEGFTRKEIAGKLDISVNTVHVHSNNIMQKLNIHKKADLIRFALKESITQV